MIKMVMMMKTVMVMMLLMTMRNDYNYSNGAKIIKKSNR